MVKEKNKNFILVNIILVMSIVSMFILYMGSRSFNLFSKERYIFNNIVSPLLLAIHPYLVYLISGKLLKKDGSYYKIKLLKRVIKINKDNYKNYNIPVIKITVINLVLVILILLLDINLGANLLNSIMFLLIILAFNFKKRILSYLLLFIFILTKIYLIFAIVTVIIDSFKVNNYSYLGGLAIWGILVFLYIPALLINIVVNYITIGIQTYKENKENKIKYLNSINKQNEYEDIID